VFDHATPEVKAAIQSGDMTINAAYKATQQAPYFGAGPGWRFASACIPGRPAA